MAFENTRAELGILLDEYERANAPHDRHELYLTIMGKLNELKAFGMPLPEDLVTLERELEAEFAEDEREARAAENNPATGPADKPQREGE
jgi:hypothetical protein